MMRIGLIGATGIAVRAVLKPALRRSDTVVVAIAATDVARARGMAAEHGIARVHPDYAAVLADPEVDAVYVSTHPAAHAALVLAALRAGKHVLVEKPFCLGAREAELLSMARSRAGLALTEAVMTAHHPWQDSLAALASGNGLGPLREVRTFVRFARSARPGYRAWPELGGGAFHDVAPYWLQMLQRTRGLDACATGRSAFGGPADTDTAFSACLTYGDGVQATLDCALEGPYRASHEFVYASGSVLVRDFLLPAAGRLRLNLLVRRQDSAPLVTTFEPVDLYARQLAAFVRCVGSGGAGDGLAEAVERAHRTEEMYVQALRTAQRPLVAERGSL
ncbi:Gfo/Idh/MocA family protein [Streptomyces sp. NPDC091272]|uniref:Gfo/Idh/MocA family protein n=1 Tax=Streptomyces sp. NPDC091272 TaxID=3365981 RepID=UPI00381A008A